LGEYGYDGASPRQPHKGLCPLNPFQIAKNPDFMRNFIIFALLKKQGFRGATPDGDAGATVYSERVSPCIPLFPPRVGVRGVEQITI